MQPASFIFWSNSLVSLSARMPLSHFHVIFRPRSIIMSHIFSALFMSKVKLSSSTSKLLQPLSYQCCISSTTFSGERGRNFKHILSLIEQKKHWYGQPRDVIIGKCFSE